MDDPGADRTAPSLSIIPYDNNRDVVLRLANTIVYRDPRTNQLVPYRHEDGIARRSTDCPTCGRPWHSSPTRASHDNGSGPREDQPTFITHDYFNMLARSLPGSQESSAPPSPRRRLVQPVRSRLQQTAAVSRPPPPDAEFVTSVPAPASSSHGISETAFSPHYFEKFFVEERELGRGGRGVVLLVKHVLDNVTLGHFACKRVPIGDDHAWLEKVLIEVQLLQGLSHQNLVSYRHVWLEDFQASPFGPSVPCAFILQQYCNGGDMHNYVLGSAQTSMTTQELKERMRRRSRGEAELPRRPHEPKKLPFDIIYTFFRDITTGLRFLHHNNFIHRDLKPSNCLLHTTAGETRVLVSDFGEVQYEYAARRSTGATGTISYCAPEVLRRISPDGPFENFTSKSDIFSLGMILHFLCFAKLPYRSADVLHEEREDVDELRAEIMSWDGFDDQHKMRPELPAALYAFLKRLLSTDPEHRPSADDILQVVSSGRLDDIPATRRRNSMEPEELTPGRRIQKLDTPQQGNSPQRGIGRAEGAIARRSKYRNQAESAEAGQVKADPSDSNAGDSSGSEAEGASGHATGSTRRARFGSSTKDTIILRSRRGARDAAPQQPSPPQKGSTNESTEWEEERQRQPLLLGPVERNPPTGMLSLLPSRLVSALGSQLTSPALRTAILGLKLMSSLQPCLGTGINAVAVYPILCIALVEFSIVDMKMWMTALALILHLLGLVIMWRWGVLCLAGPTTGFVAWDDDGS